MSRKLNREESVTVIIKRQAKPGRERELEEWISGISKEALQFEGHLGQNIIRPARHTKPEYVIIFRFDTYRNMEQWHNSDARARWLKKVEDITVGEPNIEAVPGMDYWFDLSSLEGAPQPPKWKMALVIFVVLTPLVILIGSVISALFGDIHRHLRQILSIFTTVIVMTWLVMPAVTTLLKSWLFRR